MQDKKCTCNPEVDLCRSELSCTLRVINEQQMMPPVAKLRLKLANSRAHRFVKRWRWARQMRSLEVDAFNHFGPVGIKTLNDLAHVWESWWSYDK